MIGEQITTDLHRLVYLGDSLRHCRLFRDIYRLVHFEIEVHDHRKCFNSWVSIEKEKKISNGNAMRIIMRPFLPC